MTQFRVRDKTNEKEAIMPVTTEQLNEACATLAELRDKEREIADLKKEATSAVDHQEMRIREMLKESDLKSYKSPVGLVSLTYRTSVKVPKTPEDIQALKKYLDEIGKTDQVLKPNSQALNALYKEEFEIAMELGRDTFEIPGINEVTMDENLSFRRS